MEIAARILLASEGAPVGADGRITPEGVKRITERTAEIIRARGFTPEQVKAYGEDIRASGSIQRVSTRVTGRFGELKGGG